eukprot:494201-Amphidinium_carterae.1
MASVTVESRSDRVTSLGINAATGVHEVGSLLISWSAFGTNSSRRNSGALCTGPIPLSSERLQLVKSLVSESSTCQPAAICPRRSSSKYNGADLNPALL